MKPARFDPTLVRYSPRWLGAGAAAGTLAALAVQFVFDGIRTSGLV